MIHLVSKASVHAFYKEAIRSGRKTAEDFYAPVSDRFHAFLNSIGDETARTALDLGYGAGAYTIALARAGFRVLAVDQIPSDALIRQMTGGGEWGDRIEPRECLIEEMTTSEDFGVVVAKDVLHYLARGDVESLLADAVARSRGENHHYLEVFAGITRTSPDGRQRRIEGEADYSPGGFRRVVERIYEGWELTLLWSAHTERDVRTGRNCFEATRATVIAANRAA
jgi:hypothetical protein